MGWSVHTYSRSPMCVRALEWLYDNPDGATLIWREGILISSQGRIDYTTLRALSRAGEVHQTGSRPERFSKANSAGVEHTVTFTLCEHVRSGIRWQRETPPAEKAAVHIEGNVFMVDDGRVRGLLTEAAAWLRTKGKEAADSGSGGLRAG